MFAIKHYNIIGMSKLQLNYTYYIMLLYTQINIIITNTFIIIIRHNFRRERQNIISEILKQI